MDLGILDHVWVAFILLLSLGAAWSSRRSASPTPAAEVAPMATAEKWSVYLGSSLTLWILGGVSIGVWLLGGRPLSELGFRTPDWTWPATTALAVFLAGLALDTRRQLSPERIERTRDRWRSETPFMPATRGELARYSMLAISAGLGEEIAFRGFLIAYLAAFFGLEWPGVALTVGLPALFFGIAHTYQGVRGFIGTAAGAMAFGFILIETGSLWPLIVFHALWDLAAGVPGLRLMRDEP